MSATMPELGTACCAVHRDVQASFVCPRCGDYGCVDCVRRVTERAQPVCPACWAQRQRLLGEREQREALYLPKVVLGIGIASLVPCLWPLQVGGIVVALIALGRTRGAGSHMALAGLALSFVGLALSGLVLLGLGGMW